MSRMREVELEASKSNLEKLKSEMDTHRVIFSQVEFELTEKSETLRKETQAKREIQQRYQEHLRESAETKNLLEQALENLNEDFQDQKEALKRQLDLLRLEHKAAIKSFENAFRAKLAEVCSQRDEYAEAVDSLREELAGFIEEGPLATSPSSASVCKLNITKDPLQQNLTFSSQQVELVETLNFCQNV